MESFWTILGASMAGIDLLHALRSEVEDAVRRGVPAGEIVKQFKGGASQAAIYSWVAAERQRLRDVSGGAPAPVITPVYPVASLPSAGSIPYLERLNANLAMLDSLMAIAVRDGNIRNPRMALEVTKELGVQLSRAARINSEMQDFEAQRRFMRSLADIIHEEAPEVRDRIIAKMRAVSATGGVL